MTPSFSSKAGLFLAAGVAALSIQACEKNAAAPGGSPNGAYVSGSTDTSLPVNAPPPPEQPRRLPPHREYTSVSDIPPPPLPEYDQPPMPEPGDIWTPGYWDWSDQGDDYYWVPGAWVAPPEPGLYWTPGYWRYYDGSYLFSPGYWGPEVGFYGGVDYGWGYGGSGYSGGRWRDGAFWYNRQANNFGGRRFDRVYSEAAPRNGSRTSFAGGPGGLRFAPTQAQVRASQARHAPPTPSQGELARFARSDPRLRATANRGAPPIAATQRPTGLHGPGAFTTAARSPGNYTPPPRPQRPGARPGPQGQAPAAGPFRPQGPAPAGPRAEFGRQPPQHAPAPGGGPPAAPFHAPQAPRNELRVEPRPEPRPGPHAEPHVAPRAAPQMERAPFAPRREAQPVQHHEAPRAAAPSFHAAPTPRFHEAPHAAAPAYHTAPSFHAAPAPSFHAAPPPRPAAPAFHPAPPAPHPAAPPPQPHQGQPHPGKP